MQRPGASCLATAVRTLTTGSHATGRVPADDPLPVPTVDGALRAASAASPEGIRTMTEESVMPGTLKEIVTPPRTAATGSRSPLAERSTLTAVDSPTGMAAAASPRWTGPSKSFPADTSRCTAPSASTAATTPRVPEAMFDICRPYVAMPHDRGFRIQRGPAGFRSGLRSAPPEKKVLSDRERFRVTGVIPEAGQSPCP